MNRRRVLCVSVLVAIAVALCHIHPGDVAVYDAGGRAVFGGDLYGVRVGAYGFTYPPFAAELFAMFAWLPVPAMFTGLTAASAAALYVVLRRSAPDVEHSWKAVACVAPLVMTQPVIATLEWGQIDLVLAALVLHDLLVQRRGVLVGLAAAVKLTPAVFVVYLLLCGRRREARTATVTFFGAAGVGAVLAPAASWRYWTHDAFAGAGIGGFDHVANQSVRGLAERMLGAGPGTTAWLLLAGPLLVLGLVLARGAARDGNEILAAGIAGVTACLVSPVAWTHHWVWCIPCLVGLPVLARLVLGALFTIPLGFGHTVGLGYPIIALVALAVGWDLRRRRTRRSTATPSWTSLSPSADAPTPTSPDGDRNGPDGPDHESPLTRA